MRFVLLSYVFGFPNWLAWSQGIPGLESLLAQSGMMLSNATHFLFSHTESSHISIMRSVLCMERLKPNGMYFFYILHTCISHKVITLCETQPLFTCCKEKQLLNKYS